MHVPLLRLCMVHFVSVVVCFSFFFFQAEDGIRDSSVTGVQTCALPIFLLLEGSLSEGDHRRRRRLDVPYGRVAPAPAARSAASSRPSSTSTAGPGSWSTASSACCRGSTSGGTFPTPPSG